MTRAVPLGLFDLGAPFARGGMAEVWSGVHRPSGAPVAIKLLTGAQARESRLVQCFHDEVRAMAALDHPGVVLVHDYGQVSEETAGAAGGALVAGSPFLAMERIEGGPYSAGSVRDWGSLRRLLRELLDALAHAHARGVVHRDLKPANLLQGPRGEVKLTDFGIAHALRSGQGPGEGGFVGTPAYMAPEQCWGDWRDLGPWTDLYAVGCLVYSLAAGAPPFDASRPFDVFDLQINAAPPPFLPGFQLPEGFAVWHDRLLRKHPHERFQRAADAAAALARLGEPGFVSLLEITADERGRDTLSTPPGPARPTLEGPPPAVEGAARSVPDATRAPAPSDWRVRHEPERREATPGLGLYDLRTLPFVGREAERERLWDAVRDLHDGPRGTRVMLVRGPTGVGKSRLCEWLCERAHELGAATPLRATHDASGTSGGLAAMVGRHLRLGGLSRPAVRGRVHRLFERFVGVEPGEADALAAMVAPAAPDTTGEMPLLGPADWHRLLGRHLVRLSEERPVLLWLDDIHFGLDALLCVRSLLDQTDGRLLVMLTAREELLAERPSEARILESLLATGRVQTLELGPLGDAEHAALVRTLLDLEPDLARRVELRTEGNPLFAVQLVRSWVQRGVLVHGPAGYRLAEGAQVDLPTDLHEVWNTRIARLLSERPADDVLAVEIAAALGGEVDDGEWAAACAAAGVRPSLGLRDDLLRARLARTAPSGGWVFAHSMLRESLLRAARDGRRLKGHHAACARMLGRIQGSPDRRGGHLLAAGERQAAATELAKAARAYLCRAELSAAERALSNLKAALGGRRDVPEAAEAQVLEGWLATERGELQRGRSLAEDGARVARAHGRPGLEGEALLRLGRAEYEMGRMRDALVALGRAREALQQAGRGDLVGAALRRAGQATLALGRYGEAERLLRRASEACARSGAAEDAALALLDRAHLAGLQGRVEHAVGLVRAARRGFPAGARVLHGAALVELGAAQRLAGRLGDARRSFEEALQAATEAGSLDAARARLGLALVAEARGDFEGAARELHAALPELERRGRAALAAAAHLHLLPCSAAARDWDAWDRHFAAADELLDLTRVVHRDLAMSAHVGADLATSAGEPGRAAGAWRWALAQWQELGEEEPAAEAAAGLRAAVYSAPP